MKRNGACDGICADCLHETACALRPDDGLAVWLCNEYEGTAHASVTTPASGVAAATPTSPGLCGDCEESRVCTLTSQQVAIWQCEDYR